MLENQGLLGIAFFEASAFIILLVLFSLFRRDQHGGYFRFWLVGWFCFTLSAVCEALFLAKPITGLNLACFVGQAAAIPTSAGRCAEIWREALRADRRLHRR